MELCKCLLETCPMNCQLLEALVALYLQTNQHDKAGAVWLSAFEKNPQNAEVFYHTCKFFILQVKKKKSLIILKYFFVFNSFLFILYDVSGISLSRKLFLVFFPLENVLGIPSLFARNTLHSSSVALIILLRSFVSSCFIYYKNFVRARTMS